MPRLKQDLVLIGAGGLGREVMEAVRAVNQVKPTWNLLGFLDDAVEAGTVIAGVEVLGPVHPESVPEGAEVVLCAGSPKNNFTRPALVRRLGLDPERYATIIHPAASLSASSEVGPGSVLLAQVVLTASVQVGRHVVVMPGAVLTHDDQVQDYCTFGAGVRLGGGVRLGEGVYAGSGALVRENLEIGPWALLGMGAVVLEDVPPAEVWVGSPAHRLRRVDRYTHRAAV